MRIDELINNYLEGMTTLDEERQLRRWFAATPLEKMTDEQRKLAPLFGAINEERAELAQREKDAIANLPQKQTPRRWFFFAAAGAVAASLFLGIFLYTSRSTIAVEPAITMTIGGVKVEGDKEAKEFANEQMKKLARIMNKNTVDQKFGIFKKMVLRADNLLEINNEEITEENE